MKREEVTKEKTVDKLELTLENYNFVKDLESEIMANIRVVLKDKRGKTLWTCNKDEWQDELFAGMELEVEQNLNMNIIMERIIKCFENRYKNKYKKGY